MGSVLSIIQKLAVLGPLIEQGLLALEPQEKAFLDSLVSKISSPDFQAAAAAFEAAVLSIEDTEIKKLG